MLLRSLTALDSSPIPRSSPPRSARAATGRNQRHRYEHRGAGRTAGLARPACAGRGHRGTAARRTLRMVRGRAARRHRGRPQAPTASTTCPTAGIPVAAGPAPSSHSSGQNQSALVGTAERVPILRCSVDTARNQSPRMSAGTGRNRSITAHSRRSDPLMERLDRSRPIPLPIGSAPRSRSRGSPVPPWCTARRCRRWLPAFPRWARGCTR